MIIPSNTLTFLQNYTSLEDNAKCYEFLGPGLQEVQTCGRVTNNGINTPHSMVAMTFSYQPQQLIVETSHVKTKRIQCQTLVEFSVKRHKHVTARKFSNQSNTFTTK